MSARWIYRGNDLRNWQRPTSPKFVVITPVGNGENNLPRTGGKRRKFGWRR